MSKHISAFKKKKNYGNLVLIKKKCHKYELNVWFLFLTPISKYQEIHHVSRYSLKTLQHIYLYYVYYIIT